MVETVQPTSAHVDELADNLRAADRVELRCSGHTDHRKAIADSLACSTHMATVLIDGRVAAILGLAPLSLVCGVAAPWLLGTDLVTRHRRALMRLAPSYIGAMLRAYPHLVNMVHADNEFAVRWLRRAGFTFHPAQPHPATGAPFHRFEMQA
ncbi:hypothetical protein SOM08_06215 [Hydrogenophaga sp. SNF1]|uniref:hypothetical protein n=1 Tax=Hydrogenophaga sp. SNF1 TaxID=3098762 RepID=UPI002ACBE0CC|nr:hypothetical protein [Hydrogenophaga sp. SNF1]WQB84906.1 hypothetical protein SOM08_06215 [Hydrogenophaga sp. SNF1]